MAKKRLVILDTHAILHRAYHALPDFSSSRGEPTGGLYGLVAMLVRIIGELNPEYVVAAIDLPGGTFRDAAYKEYKGTRAKIDDALVEQIKRTPGLLKAMGIPVYSAKGFEADDVVGTIVEEMKGQKDLELIIASGDMDTLQLVNGRVKVFTLRKGLNDTVMYDEARVRERYGFGPESVPDLKGLAGDVSDNIKGVPGVGQGSALKVLQRYGNVKALYAAIKKEGAEAVAKETGVQKRFIELIASHKEEAEFSKLLATIRRDAPISFEIPAVPWKEGVDTEALLSALAEFDFRSLMPRIKQLLSIETKEEPQETELSAADAQALEPLKLAVSVLDSTIAKPEPEDIWRMGKSHDLNTARAHLLAQIKKDGLSVVYEKIELPLSPVLRKMEKHGIKVDAQFLRKLSKEYTKELTQIAERVYERAGREFNIGSPKQLGEVLFDGLGLVNKKKTAGGQRSTREAELVKLKDEHPIIADILAYRELSKLLSTYIDSIPKLLDKEGRLHTSYIQIGAATGRIASQNPNLQNIPIKSELGRAIRRAFIPSEGMKLVSFDYSQIELRLAAILSRDEGLSDIFKAGRDVHAEVAARVFRVPSAEVTYEQRRRAKVINFGILYGMGVTALQQSLGTKRAEAQEFYDQYFAVFPRLAAYIEELKADAAKKGYVTTLFGRRRYLEGIHSSIPYVRSSAERMAINAPMQGTQADIIKLAMVEIDELLSKEGGHLLLQVHDELVFEIETARVATLSPRIKEIMEHVLPQNQTHGVPIVAEGKSGPDWGDMQPL